MWSSSWLVGKILKSEQTLDDTQERNVVVRHEHFFLLWNNLIHGHDYHIDKMANNIKEATQFIITSEVHGDQVILSHSAIFYEWLVRLFIHQATPTDMRICLLSCLSLIVVNLPHERASAFIAGDLIGTAIKLAPLQMDDDDLTSRYISFLKSIALRIDLETLPNFISQQQQQPLWNDEGRSASNICAFPSDSTEDLAFNLSETLCIEDCPIFHRAFTLLLHKDRLISVTARTILLHLLTLAGDISMNKPSENLLITRYFSFVAMPAFTALLQQRILALMHVYIEACQALSEATGDGDFQKEYEPIFMSAHESSELDLSNEKISSTKNCYQHAVVTLNDVSDELSFLEDLFPVVLKIDQCTGEQQDDSVLSVSSNFSAMRISLLKWLTSNISSSNHWVESVAGSLVFIRWMRLRPFIYNLLWRDPYRKKMSKTLQSAILIQLFTLQGMLRLPQNQRSNFSHLTSFPTLKQEPQSFSEIDPFVISARLSVLLGLLNEGYTTETEWFDQHSRRERHEFYNDPTTIYAIADKLVIALCWILLRLTLLINEYASISAIEFTAIWQVLHLMLSHIHHCKPTQHYALSGTRRSLQSRIKKTWAEICQFVYASIWLELSSTHSDSETVLINEKRIEGTSTQLPCSIERLGKMRFVSANILHDRKADNGLENLGLANLNDVSIVSQYDRSMPVSASRWSLGTNELLSSNFSSESFGSSYLLSLSTQLPAGFSSKVVILDQTELGSYDGEAQNISPLPRPDRLQMLPSDTKTNLSRVFGESENAPPSRKPSPFDSLISFGFAESDEFGNSQRQQVPMISFMPRLGASISRNDSQASSMSEQPLDSHVDTVSYSHLIAHRIQSFSHQLACLAGCECSLHSLLDLQQGTHPSNKETRTIRTQQMPSNLLEATLKVLRHYGTNVDVLVPHVSGHILSNSLSASGSSVLFSNLGHKLLREDKLRETGRAVKHIPSIIQRLMDLLLILRYLEKVPTLEEFQVDLADPLFAILTKFYGRLPTSDNISIPPQLSSFDQIWICEIAQYSPELVSPSNTEQHILGFTYELCLTPTCLILRRPELSHNIFKQLPLLMLHLLPDYQLPFRLYLLWSVETNAVETKEFGDMELLLTFESTSVCRNVSSVIRELLMQTESDLRESIQSHFQSELEL